MIDIKYDSRGNKQVEWFINDLIRNINRYPDEFHNEEDIYQLADDLTDDLRDCGKIDRHTDCLILRALAKAEISFN